LGSGVFDQDQYDLHYAHALFILDESVDGRRDPVSQTIQHFLHGEVLLSAYFPMPCPGSGSGDLQVLCPAEPVVMPVTAHQRKKDPPPGCRNQKTSKPLSLQRLKTVKSSFYGKETKIQKNKSKRAKIDICKCVNMSSDRAERPVD
jgi:hypothetical protein